MNNIPISCKCITYGRVEFLEESIESFLRQKYEGERELVIVNDYPEQTLIYNHPDIRIYNLDKTFETIGEKENFAVNLCKFNTIAVWDDDDLALSNHLNNINLFMPGNDLLHWQNGIFMNSYKISALTGLGNSGIVYTKEIWEKVGRHSLENAGYDMTFVVKIKNTPNVNIISAAPSNDEVSWIYVWAGRGYHMSGMGTDTPDRPNVIQRNSEYVESLRVNKLIPVGNIELKPRWKHDYELLLKEYNGKV